MSMGYQVGVTPLQRLSACRQRRRFDAATPGACAHHDARRSEADRSWATISKDTAAMLTDIMEQIVERGPDVCVVEGHTVAGKDRHGGEARQSSFQVRHLRRLSGSFWSRILLRR
jgi:hypothetical protein